MIAELIQVIERLNLSHQQSFAGSHFSEIIALMSIVFGGSFLLFGWKHHEYYLGITGFLVGGWAGLLLKTQASSAGTVAPFLYVGVCAVGGAFVAVQFRQLIGMLLGGFTAAVFGLVLAPSIFRPGEHGLVAVSAAFLMGGGLGAMFPKFFFVFNSALIGSVFITYGVSIAVLTSFTGGAGPNVKAIVHLLVFLPVLLFGILYQMITSQREEILPVPAAPHPPAQS
ncbi:MAG: hypothetical protein HYY16_11060 [Planctomycetes bacterium]|nr:hypothetical protein [Planctomycetota bacterium]